MSTAQSSFFCWVCFVITKINQGSCRILPIKVNVGLRCKEFPRSGEDQRGDQPKVTDHLPNSQFPTHFCFSNAFLMEKRVFQTSSSSDYWRKWVPFTTFAPNSKLPVATSVRVYPGRATINARIFIPLRILHLLYPKEYFLLIVASWFLCRDQIPIVLFLLSSAH